MLAESLMESTCVITRAGAPTVDHSTGQTTTNPTTIYTGKCRLRFPFVRPQQVDAQGQLVEKARGIIELPISDTTTALVRTDDIATITVNPSDPSSVGAKFRIESPFTETHATSRRLPVEVIS